MEKRREKLFEEDVCDLGTSVEFADEGDLSRRRRWKLQEEPGGDEEEGRGDQSQPSDQVQQEGDQDSSTSLRPCHLE